MCIWCFGRLHVRPNQEASSSKSIQAHFKCCWWAKIPGLLLWWLDRKRVPICSFDGGKVVANLPPDIPVPAPSNIQPRWGRGAPWSIRTWGSREESSEEVDEEVTVAADSNEQPSGMFWQLPTEQEAAVVDSEKDYATVKNLACNKVKSLLEQDVVMQ